MNTQAISPAVSTLDTYVQLQVVVQQQEHQAEVSSEDISFPFLPAFYVHTSEVHLSNLLPLTSVRISAVDKVIQDLKVHKNLSKIWLLLKCRKIFVFCNLYRNFWLIQVTSNDTSIVEVLPIERDSQSEHVMHYPIRLKDRATLWELEKLDVEIEVKCVATSQRKTIPVRVKLIGQRQELGLKT